MTRAVPPLWLCADLAMADGDALVHHVARALAVTPTVVWLRAPHDVSARSLAQLARRVLPLTRAAGGMLLVGDRVDVAVATGADGVHLPERSLRAEDVRALAARHGRELFVSAAVHDRDGVVAARDHVDALVISPFGSVPGKGAPLGPSGFRALRDDAPGRFAVALGGITTPDDVRAARDAGADAVAVRRALLDVGALEHLAREWT